MFKKTILIFFCFLFTLSNFTVLKAQVNHTEKTKARYSFKKGAKNQKIIDKLNR